MYHLDPGKTSLCTGNAGIPMLLDDFRNISITGLRYAELLPKSVLIGYAQSGKCNERQASNYADSSAFIRSHNQTVSKIILI